MKRVLDAQDPAKTYAAVLDALPAVAWLAAPDGRVTYVSAEWERFTGADARSIREDGYAQFIHPDDLALVVETWDAARAAGTPYSDQFRFRFGDSAYRWVLSQANPMVEDGAIVGWFGTVSDVHDLHLTQERLKRALADAATDAEVSAARARFVERLMDASDDCIKVLDLDAHLVSMSANGQRALAIMDFLSVAGADWLTFWNGDDRVAATEAVAAARAGGRGRFTGLFAVEGREKWWDVTVTPIVAEDGKPEQLLAVSRDVTDRILATRAIASSEERYRLIGESLPGVTWTATPDGMLDHIVGSESSNRLPVDERLGDAWLRTVHPHDLEMVRSRWNASLASGEPYEVIFRVRTIGGTFRWQLVRALAQRAQDGTIVRWIGVNVDVDDQRRADEAREQFVRLAEMSEDFIGIADASGNATYVNAAGRSMLGASEPNDGARINLVDHLTPETRADTIASIQAGLARDGRWAGEVRARHASGERIPIWYSTFALFDDAGDETGVASVARDLRGRYRIEAGLRALAEAGAAMYGSLDFDGTMRNVADAVARSFASYALVDALGDDGTIRSVASSHGDPRIVEILGRIAVARNVMPDHPVALALKTGRSTLVPEVPANWMDLNGARAAVGDDVLALDIHSYIVVPIRSSQDGRIFGALSCAMNGDDPRGRYSADDLRFAEEIAVRAALAFDHARAYERERRIAVTLQEASLPARLPTLDHLYLSADYRPGNSEATIGGDWYDAFALEDGRVVITIGDVLGNGLGAAVTMGKVRQAMQSVGLVLPDPNTMLAAADRTVRAHSDEMYATALAGIFDPARHEFTFASAGHPGPALRLPDGSIEEFTAPGIMLGLRSVQPTRTVTIAAPPGSSLVFFTDGLVEATRDIDAGHARVHAAMADLAVAADAEPARALVEHVLGGKPATDDIAVLVAEIGPSARFDERLRTAAQLERDRA